jgi:uncharacterized membrane protein
MSDLPADSTATTAPPAAPSPAIVWTLRALAVVALAISGYLTRLSYTGQTAIGCGRASGLDCEHVLNSRWSYWIDGYYSVPVSAAAAGLWLTVLLVSLLAGVPSLPGIRRVTWWLLTVLATSAAGAAVWFVGLQAFKLHHWCLYCLATHACGLLAFAMTIGQRQVSAKPKWMALIVGIGLAGLIPLGQQLYPRETEYELNLMADAPGDSPRVIAGYENRLTDASAKNVVAVLGGATQISLKDVPHVGSTDGKYVVVLLSDYACGHCRKLHQELLLAQREYEGELTIVLLPTPLSHRCNSQITKEASTAEHACELAKLSLIVWQLKPAAFAEFDAWLFIPLKERSLDEAQAKAAEIVGADELAVAEQDPRYDAWIQQHVGLYTRSPAELIPQIMGRNVILSGGVESAGDLLEALEQDFHFPRP